MDWADTSRSFSRDRIWDPAQLAVCGVAVVIGIVCVITHVRQTRGDTKLTEQLHLVSETLQTNSSNTVKESNNSDPMKEYRYDAYTAWLRAGIFISSIEQKSVIKQRSCERIVVGAICGAS